MWGFHRLQEALGEQSGSTPGQDSHVMEQGDHAVMKEGHVMEQDGHATGQGGHVLMKESHAVEQRIMLGGKCVMLWNKRAMLLVKAIML